MTTPREPDAVDSPGADPNLAPPDTSPPTPEHAAGDQFVHGLLSFLHMDSRARQDRRMARVLSAIDSESAVAGRIGPARRRFNWRTASGIIAAALVLTGVLAILVPTEQSATATVQTSLAALDSGGDRRYEVRVLAGRDTEFPKNPMATVDVRDRSHVLVKAITPRGHQITLGRDDEGRWMITPEGDVNRFPPRQAWPRWLDLGESTVLVESIDSRLETMTRDYDLKKSAPEPLPGAAAGAPTFQRITAQRTGGPSPEPARIELWIDGGSRLVKRMELHWPEAQWGRDRPLDGGGREGPGGDRPFPPRDRRSHDPGFDDEMDLPPGPPPHDEPPPLPEDDEPDADRPPLPDGHTPPAGRPGPDDRRPRPMRPRPGPDGQPPFDGPRRPGRDGGAMPPPQGPRGPRPRFLDGPPDFAGPRQPPPPRVMVFELVDAPALPDGWFSPAQHAK
ncbi:MAG: hypothetical protein KF745_08645 [Phycisphaeraceae bacterium]|nr:hypothetical protein [Phycisphaeraceae bacterium]